MKAIVMVMDSVGVGALPDAHLFGDTEGHNTLGNTARAVGGLRMPNMERLGLGKITEVMGISADVQALGAYGRMAELSQGKDTTVGHWELMGLITHQPMPTFPQGFPADLMAEFERRIGRKTLGNKAASGTEIIEELGEVHQHTAYPIVYTSADSVFQIAAHEGVIPLAELYDMCQSAREMLTGPWAVGRVIARPFIGAPGSYSRTSHRHDYSLEPPQPTLLDSLKNQGVEVVGVGKIHDIFAGRGLTQSLTTKNNREGMEKTLQAYKEIKDGLVFTNLVEFDSLFGHRNNPQGYAQKLEEMDLELPPLLEAVVQEGLLFIVADHGNDPTEPSTDHSREYVPLLVYGQHVKADVDLQTRATFADLAATLAEFFKVPYTGRGESFLSLLMSKGR